LEYSRGIVEVEETKRRAEETVSAKIVNGPTRKAPYSRREARDRAIGVRASRTDDGPWEIYVTWKRLKIDGDFAQRGADTGRLGASWNRTESPEMIAFGKTLARELGIEWEPEDQR
jgi:hypothetical protein